MLHHNWKGTGLRSWYHIEFAGVGLFFKSIDQLLHQILTSWESRNVGNWHLSSPGHECSTMEFKNLEKSQNENEKRFSKYFFTETIRIV
jgi:hypothetical protein